MCYLIYFPVLASGEWWDTILADSDRWGALKFTIRPVRESMRIRYTFSGVGRCSDTDAPNRCSKTRYTGTTVDFVNVARARRRRRSADFTPSSSSFLVGSTGGERGCPAK